MFIFGVHYNFYFFLFLCSSNLLLSPLNIFIIITLNSLLGKLLIFTSLNSFGVLSCSFGIYSFVASFCQNLCFYFYLSHGLHFSALENCPFVEALCKPAVHFPLVTRAICSKYGPLFELHGHLGYGRQITVGGLCA